MRLILAQMGARRHYAVPRILYGAGMLHRFYTDICATKGWPRLLRAIPKRWHPPSVKRLTGRIPEGIPSRQIIAFTGFGHEYARRRKLATSTTETEAVHLWAGQTFCRLVLKHGVGLSDGLYAFNSAALELLEYAEQNGLRSIVEQTIAPTEVIAGLLKNEAEAFPGWVNAQDADHDAAEFIARERAEWQKASIILCGSQFVQNAIASAGGPVSRCVVVPYGVANPAAVSARPMNKGPLRVLTIGAVGLRKGTPYVLEAAERLGNAAHFRMVGVITIPPAIEKHIRRHVELTGPVPRNEVGSHYNWADVFVLPSICEGSAIVTYEALAAGLPVICTPNTGSVVRDGVDGFIVPIRDSGAIVKRLGRLAVDRELLCHMGTNARANDSWSLRTYAKNLLTCITGLSLV